MTLDIRRPTTQPDHFLSETDPTYAYDGSGTATYATLFCHVASSISTYSAISNANKPTYTALSLRIYLDAVFGADSGDCSFNVLYSTNSGTSYTSIGGPWTSNQTGLDLTQALSTSLDLSTLRIKISAVGGLGEGQTVELTVYDIWTEGTLGTSGAAFFANFC
jgi:hypothetical protein